MKDINNYINEKLSIGTDNIYTESPQTKEELQQIIIDRIKNKGPNCNLNDIYTGDITDMSELFDAQKHQIFKKINCNISDWDVSSVSSMEGMFYNCEEFNCNISGWNVSGVKNMSGMFCGCLTFNSDISDWDVSSVENMSCMFLNCASFNSDISDWDVRNVNNASYMFYKCYQFDGAKLQDWIKKWNVNTNNVHGNHKIFYLCNTAPAWYKE